jgi:hypothetical protein
MQSCEVCHGSSPDQECPYCLGAANEQQREYDRDMRESYETGADRCPPRE